MEEKADIDEAGCNEPIIESKHRISYLNGQIIDESEAKISIFDHGFTHGDAAYDVARTFNHRPYKLKEHIERLYRSLCYIQIDPMLTQKEMYEISLKISDFNTRFLSPNDDHRIVWRVTRGDGTKINGPQGPVERPTILIHCDPVSWRNNLKFYREGVHLIVSRTRVEDPQTIDVKAKLHSKLAHVLAGLEAKMVDPQALGLLLDMRGCIAESSAANFFMVSKGRLLTPTTWNILSGITRDSVIELARKLGIEIIEKDLSIYDLYNADEVFLTTTSYFIGPISKVDTICLRGPFPGPITKQLMSAFSEQVGVDIVQQAIINMPNPMNI